MRESHLRGGIFAAGIVCGFFLSHFFLSAPTPAPAVPAPPVIERQVDAVKPVEIFLPAPRIRTPGILRSDINGQVYLRFTESKGAETYEIRVTDPAGAEVKNYTIKRTVTMIKELRVDPKAKETPYKVQITPLGPNGERGTPSEIRDIAMIPMRNLAPPTIKSITTED